MNNRELKGYLYRRLEELNHQNDMNETILYGKISFGIESSSYSHIPAWKSLLAKKKLLVRGIWVQAFLLSLIVVGITADIWTRMQENWMRALAGWLLLAIFIMFLYVIQSYYTLFVSFRNAEREVRKLIYQDLLQKIEMTERAQESVTNR
jgi:hypothetical protein